VIWLLIHPPLAEIGLDMEGLWLESVEELRRHVMTADEKR
jgi:hypothetical protein